MTEPEYNPVSGAYRYPDGSIWRPIRGSEQYVSLGLGKGTLILGPLYERVPDYSTFPHGPAAGIAPGLMEAVAEVLDGLDE